MSYCINPNCPNPKVPENSDRPTCFMCGSDLLLQGRYRVKRKLSQGGFGTTYEVEAGEEKKVLKVLHKNHPKAVELFKREAKVLIDLNHPGIPKVEEGGYFTFVPTNLRKKPSEEPLHCFIMNFIEGVNLHDWMKERRWESIDEDTTLDWLEQLADIIAEIHKKDYFHRDIKPKNIILKPDGKLVLIDFGAVKELENLENSGTRLISPGYTPPEQIEGKAVPQSDFFSLGRTFIFLLTGKQPKDFSLDYNSKLQWRKYANKINHQTSGITGGTTMLTVEYTLPNLIDYLMVFNYQRRPSNAKVINQYIEKIRAYNKTQVEERDKKSQQKKEPKNNKQKSIAKSLLASSPKISLLLIFIFLASEIYVSWRYGVLIGNPILMVKSLTSSKFLDKSIKGKIGEVNAIAISPNGELIASGSHGKIRVWNVKTGELKQEILSAHQDKVTSLAISPNGEILVSGSADNTMRLWQLEKGIRMLTIPAHQKGINAVAISPDNQIIASAAEDGLIRLWNPNTGIRMLTLQGHTLAVNSLVFAKNNRILVSASDDGRIIVWNIDKGNQTRIFEGHKAAVKAVAISPDNLTVASGDRDGNIRVLNLETGAEKNTFKVNLGSIESLIFSRDGQTLISGGRSIIFWNLSKGKPETKLVGHGNLVSSIVLSPKSDLLISGSPDGTIKIWRMP
jgi:WD40 repeat protein